MRKASTRTSPDRPAFEELESRLLLSISPAFTDEATYQDTFFITPNGNGVLTAPMVETMIGGGDPVFGGGTYAKVGMSTAVYYARMTDGASNDYRFHVLHAPENRTQILPPDVTSLSQLPQLVRDELPSYATPAKIPLFLAELEWARYYNLPISVQIQTIGSHGGDIADHLYDINCHFESLGKDQCMWDVSDVVDPDDNPATFDPSGASWGNFTFATPTMVDPAIAAEIGYDLQFKSYCQRNLQDGIQQILEICSLPRYQGLLIGFAIDPEIHYPAHGEGTSFGRPFVEDYHPAMIYAFGKYLHERYGDDNPLTDTNGDGVTFWGDYVSEYTASGGFGHSHAAAPATWSDIDPPRYVNPEPNVAYWQEWMNFKETVIADWIEDEIDWIEQMGVPAERIFTHQTTYTQFQNDRSNWNDEQWLDSWAAMEISGGYMGISKYQPTNCGTGTYIYQNLMRRDEGWGAPEYNPYVISPGVTWATQAQVRSNVRACWDNLGHVIWAHSWGSGSYRTVDLATTKWWENTTTRGPAGWTPVNFSTGTVSAHTTARVAGAYFESPDNLNLNASDYLFFVAYMHPYLNGGVNDHEVWGIQWITTTDTTWDTDKEVTLDALKHAPFGHKDFVLNLTDNPFWTGTIKQVRLYPVSDRGSSTWIKSVAFARHTPFTLEMQSLMVDKKDTPRPTLYTPVAIPESMRLADNLDSMGSNFVVFGTNTDGDFGTAGNFYKTTVTCGGVARSAILAPAANRLCMTKTGKWRQLILPDPGDEQLLLTFRIGIRDGSSTRDGVRFRVRIRDEQRELHTLFDQEFRWNAWSDLVTLDLTAFAGQAVDLYMETHGISDTSGDMSAWADPILYVTGGAPVIAFDVTASGSKESVTPANLAVTLSQPSEQTVTIQYAVTGGTAVGGGDDYTLAAGAVTFDPGQTSRAIAVAITNDSAVEPDETLVVTLSSPVGADLGANTQHTYTILNDDYLPGQTVAVDFESAADPAKFVEYYRSTSAPWIITRVSGPYGQALSLNFEWSAPSGSLKFSPDGDDYDFGLGTVRADVRIPNGGGYGSTAGLLVKTCAGGGYVVQLYQDSNNTVLRIGCHSDPSGNRDNWEYLGAADGHSQYGNYGFVEAVLESLASDKWYGVEATMSVPTSGTLQIDVEVTDGVHVWNLSYADSGPSANTGDGLVGLVYKKLYDDPALFDNFTLVHEAPNQAPQVDAGPDGQVVRPIAASLNGTVSDDGPPAGLTITWSKVSGPGTVTFGDGGQADTTATFSAVGQYVLRLAADDGEYAPYDEMTVAVTAIDGDANGDGIVNVGDLAVLAANWQQPATSWEQADFNDDHIVNVGDLAVLAGHWGDVAGGGAAAQGEPIAENEPAAQGQPLAETVGDEPLAQAGGQAVFLSQAPSPTPAGEPVSVSQRVAARPSRRERFDDPGLVVLPGCWRRADAPSARLAEDREPDSAAIRRRVADAGRVEEDILDALALPTPALPL